MFFRIIELLLIILVMKVLAIIEKGSDGMYSVRSESKIGNSYFGGFGNNVNEAKEDFMESIEEAFAEEGKNMEDLSVSFKYDVPSFFNTFDFINASKFAAYAGINESKMRQYKAGVAYPGEKTMAKILSAARSIGQDLVSLSL